MGGTKPPLILFFFFFLLLRIRSLNGQTLTDTSTTTTTATGFTITASSSASCLPLTVLNSTSGNILMPMNGDATYRNNMDCKWEIQASGGSLILIQFTSFELEGPSYCPYDYVLVTDGYTGTRLHRDKLCERVIPADIFSMSDRVIVKFHSDGSVVYSGFSLSFSTYQKTAADCEDNGRVLRNGTTSFLDDCYEYTCLEGQLVRTGNTDEKCCRSGNRFANDYDYSWDDYIDFLEYYEYWMNSGGYYGLNMSVSRYNCSDAICVARNTWESEDCRRCDYKGFSFEHQSTIYFEDCNEFLCEDGEWIPTGAVNPRCCNYRWEDFWFDWGESIEDTDPDYFGLDSSYYRYYGLNESIPTPNCTERVCVASETWEIRVLDPAECITCEYNGYLYRTNWMTYKDDCYEYVCQNGTWEKTGGSDSNCCYYNDWVYWYDYYYSIVEGDQSGYYSLNATVKYPGCSGLTCVARESWESEDCQMCSYNGVNYHHKRILIQEDCREYFCDNGEWKLTGRTDRYCCFYYRYQLWEGSTTYASNNYYGFSDIYYDYFDINESIPLPNCSERICVARGVWEIKELDPEVCITCEYNGYLYRTNWTRYGDDCSEYICQNGEWVKTGKTNSKCCYYGWYEHWIDWGNDVDYYSSSYIFADKYYGLFESVPSANCSERVCVGPSMWEIRVLDPDDCATICEHNGQKYRSNWTRYGDDCYEYICQNGAWEKTQKTDENCCYYKGWYYFYYYYYLDISVSDNGYFGLNESVPRYSCSDLICVARNTWESEDCKVCNYNNWMYYEGETLYQQDCFEYQCVNGVWNATGNHDSWCCYNSLRYPEYDYEESRYERQQRYLWWYRDNNDWDVEYYDDLDEWVKYAVGPNETFYSSSCMKYICIARGTWVETTERNTDCCEHNGKWYYPNKPIYLEDCIGYVCEAGLWQATTYTDPKCCKNPDYVEEFNYDWWWYYYEYEYWWQDYDFSEDYRNGVPSQEWHRINGIRIGADCQELRCVGRENWQPTGIIVPGCGVTTEYNPMPITKTPHRGSKCRGGMCNVNVHVHVDIDSP